MPFDGLNVLSFESRRANEMAELIRRQRGEPFIAPALREKSVESNEQVFRFAEKLFNGGFDMFIAFTGVGVRGLNRLLASGFGETAFADALRKITVVARGPKPVAALREMGVQALLSVPEPNTWREILAVTEGRPERRIAVQEYGGSNEEFLSALRQRGAEVETVRVYHYELPEDTGPLREAVQRLASNGFAVVLFTTSAQVHHLFQMAFALLLDGAVRRNLARAVVASIGPTTTETLEEFGIVPDMSPSHPKMGILVKEAADRAHELLRNKRM